LQNLDKASDADIERMIQYLNSLPRMKYCFKDLPLSVPSLSKWPVFEKALNQGPLLLDLHRTLHHTLVESLASKGEWEHMCALQVLRELKLLKAYEDFITPFSIQSNMATARHFFYKSKIEKLAKKYLNKPLLDVFEIGAGAGNLALFLYRSGIVRNYIIIDLPEMLVLSAYTLGKYIPDAQIAFADELNDFPLSEQGGFVFVPAQNVDQLPNGAVDLCINTNSFQEMDGPTRDHYIRTIYRVGRNNALFFNCNRRQSLPQRDGSHFDNNPLLYPYANTDRVVIWQECPFQELARLRFNFTTSLAIMRTALINPA
jgi:hypothetical protein